MKPIGARGMLRVSQNPLCAVQTAMVLLGMQEEAFYKTYTGGPYRGERGERIAALRWGNRFDAGLAEDDAARLRGALHGLLGLDRASATVRNLQLEVPGDSLERLAERNQRTRAIFSDLLAGKASTTSCCNRSSTCRLRRASPGTSSPTRSSLIARPASTVRSRARRSSSARGSRSRGTGR